MELFLLACKEEKSIILKVLTVTDLDALIINNNWFKIDSNAMILIICKYANICIPCAKICQIKVIMDK